jgi:hypothetical protein
MGKKAGILSNRGNDFKKILAIAPIRDRRHKNCKGYFCSNKIQCSMKMMRPGISKFLSFFLLFLILLPFFSFRPHINNNRNTLSTLISGANTRVSNAAARFNVLYDSLGLQTLNLSRAAFQNAVQGFLALQSTGAIHNAGVLSIVDFSLPSTEKRLFIIDLQNVRLLFNTWVAHGRNSGALMATRFSNRYNSLMSSLGFYVTGDPFMGQHGYSLHLEGIEPGWNDHAHARSIIMHPAGYVSEDHIRQWGYLGRSEGCPAIPEELDQAIIDEIKGGSCLFIYAPNERYLHRSSILG